MLVFCIMLPWLVSCGKGQKQDLFFVNTGGRWGYVDRAGKYIINPQFDDARGFSEGLAPVRLAEQWGYIDEAGKYVINPQFQDAREFSDGLARVRLGDEWGYIDKEGKYAVNPQFAEAADFSEGLARVLLNDRWGFVDKQGKMAINPQYDETGDFSDGLAPVRLGAQWGFVDTKGKIVVNPQYESALPISEGLGAIVLGGKVGYIDKTGKVVINPQFEQAGQFRDGVAPFANAEGRWGFVNEAGALVVNPQFASADPFQEGLAVVNSGGKFGYVDKKGTMAIRPQFETAGSFANGMARISMNGRFGYIEKSGQIIINPQFDFATALRDEPLYAVGELTIAAPDTVGAVFSATRRVMRFRLNIAAPQVLSVNAVGDDPFRLVVAAAENDSLVTEVDSRSHDRRPHSVTLPTLILRPGLYRISLTGEQGKVALSLSEPTMMPVVHIGKRTEGIVDANGNAFFWLELLSGRNLSFRLEGAAGTNDTYEVRVLDATGRQIGYSSYYYSGYGRDEALQGSLEAGVYVLAVRPYLGGGGVLGLLVKDLNVP